MLNTDLTGIENPATRYKSPKVIRESRSGQGPGSGVIRYQVLHRTQGIYELGINGPEINSQLGPKVIGRGVNGPGVHLAIPGK